MSHTFRTFLESPNRNNRDLWTPSSRTPVSEVFWLGAVDTCGAKVIKFRALREVLERYPKFT